MVTIQPKPNDQMITDAVASYPASCRGFFYGVVNDDGNLNVTHVTGSGLGPLTGEDLQNAERIADENHVTLLGMYVSHPDNSTFPREEEATIAKPGFHYLVISVSPDNSIVIGCWKLNGMMQFEQVKIANFQIS